MKQGVYVKVCNLSDETSLSLTSFRMLAARIYTLQEIGGFPAR